MTNPLKVTTENDSTITFYDDGSVLVERSEGGALPVNLTADEVATIAVYV